MDIFEELDNKLSELSKESIIFSISKGDELDREEMLLHRLLKDGYVYSISQRYSISTEGEFALKMYNNQPYKKLFYKQKMKEKWDKWKFWIPIIISIILSIAGSLLAYYGAIKSNQGC